MNEIALFSKPMFAKNVLAAGLLFLGGLGAAQATVVAQWTFEASQPGSGGPFAAENGIYAATSMASGSHAGAATYSSPGGARSEHSFSSTVWAVGDYYQFTTSTLGYSGVSVSFEAASSGTGPRDFQIAYSTDGTTFSVFTTYAVPVNGSPNQPWSANMSAASAAVYAFTFDLSAITALDNQATVYFRLMDADSASANGGNVAAGGSSRVDDFTISASPVLTAAVPEPATFIAGVVSGLPLVVQGFRHLRRIG